MASSLSNDSNTRARTVEAPTEPVEQIATVAKHTHVGGPRNTHSGTRASGTESALGM